MGIISKTLAWITHPSNDTNVGTTDWFAFFVLAMIVGYLWGKVVRQIIEG